MAIIEFNNFSWTYYNKEEHDLHNINLRINKGEFIGIIGPTGSGKTALCYSIIGVIPHLSQGEIKSGEVIVNGLRTSEHSIGELALSVGLIMQSPQSQLTGAGLTIEEEVAFGLENYGVPRREMKDKIKRVLKKVGLYELRKRSPFEVSGGQQQKVAIASVLALEPEIIILDEPTGYLDPWGTNAVLSLVKQLNNEGKTIILVTHKLEYLSQYADRIILFNNGRVIRDDTPNKILSNYELLRKNGLTPLPVTILGKELGLSSLPSNINDCVKSIKEWLK